MRRAGSVRRPVSRPIRSGRAPGAVAVRRAALGAVLVGTLAACGTGAPDPAGSATREEPGPTLAGSAPPGDWQDVHSATGLVYSIPPDWEIGAPSGGAGAEPDPTAGSDWGSGFVTTANAIAERGYCSAAGLSFRLLSGITEPLPGDAREQALSASRAMADSIDRRFTGHGADVPVPEPASIGVSGVPAWHVSVRGRVRPPRNRCTPPVIRVDTIAVATRTPAGDPASIVFVLMADEGEPGAVETATVDAVVASLRYDNTV